MRNKTLIKRTMAGVIGSLIAMSLVLCVDISFDTIQTVAAARPTIKKRGPGGRQLFARYCITCHHYMGQVGHREGGRRKNLSNTVLPREMLLSTINYGLPQTRMPGFEGDVSDDNLYVMTDFILGELRCKEPREQSIEWKIGCQDHQ